MSELGDDWREHKKYQKIQKAKYLNVFSRSIFPSIEKQVKKLGLELRCFSANHWRVVNSENDWVDFWQTSTYMRKNCESRLGFDGLKQVIRELGLVNNVDAK